MATPSTAPTVASRRKATIVRRWGRANTRTRRSVALEKRAWVPSSCIALRSAVHAFMSTGRHAKASISL